MNKYTLTIFCIFLVPVYSVFAEVNYSDKSQHILYDKGKWQREVPIGKIGDCYEGYVYGFK